jgi:hypothetical protein
MECSEVYDYLYRKIIEDPKVISQTKPGFCRTWSDAVLDVIEREAKTTKAQVFAEARNVHIETGLSHTFVELTITIGSRRRKYTLDGLGASKKTGYFGPTSKAPKHLKRSTSDPINLYRQASVGCDQNENIRKAIMEGFESKGVPELVSFLLKLEQNTVTIADLPTGNWQGIFAGSQTDNSIVTLQTQAVRLVLTELIQRKM